MEYPCNCGKCDECRRAAVYDYITTTGWPKTNSFNFVGDVTLAEADDGHFTLKEWIDMGSDPDMIDLIFDPEEQEQARNGQG